MVHAFATDGADASSLNPFTEEEEMYRSTVRRFFDRELDAKYKDYEAQGSVPRSFWLKAGEAGILGCSIPEAFGGPGASELCGLIRAYELGRSVGGATVGSSISADMASAILMAGASDELKRKWTPGILAGEVLQCMPLTEPDAGSDATAIRTTAIRDGDDYVINGSKCFISNGTGADLLYVVAKTDPTQRGKGMSMMLVEASTPGVNRKLMQTSGYPLYDCGEFHFENVRVPKENLFLGEGRAMEILMGTFALDRLEIGARALGEAELAFDLALDYVKQRKVFGQMVWEFQNTQFKMAEFKTEIEVGRAFLYEAIRKFRAGVFTFADGAMLKLWMSEMVCRVVDGCVQMFGGSGFMDDMPISRLYRAVRLHRLYAGTSELQKVAIAKAL